MGNRRSRLSSKRRRKFKGNRYTAVQRKEELEIQRNVCPAESLDAACESSCSSSVRLRPKPDLPRFTKSAVAGNHPNKDIINEEEDFNMIIYFPILVSMFCQFARCNQEDCNSPLKMEIDMQRKSGLCHEVKVFCPNCNFSQYFDTSVRQSKLTNAKSGKPFFDVNLRTVLAFRELGKGYEAMVNFSTIMNMTKPMTCSSYQNCIDEIHKAFEEEKTLSLKKVGLMVSYTTTSKEAKTASEVSQCTVSLDGTWQTRGYSSINGIVTCMYGNKCLDYEVLSKHCRACSKWEKTNKDSVEYIEWKSSHKCPANHSGSSSSMESAGALKIFKRSVEKHSLQYSKYLGDGDSSSFSIVQSSYPYGPGVKIEKLECIGHIQKRIGGRLRKLKSDWKGKKLADGKSISGVGRLSDNAINKLQNYFGIAIRTNLDSVYGMKKCILASLFHNSLIEINKRHQFCPRTADSWCNWQKEKAEGKEAKFQPKLNIPEIIFDMILPIYKELSADELLNKCLHGKTQNSNESLHGLIWQRCPKITYSARKMVEIAAASAACHLNDGRECIRNLLNRMELNVGAHADRGLQRSALKRKHHSELRNSERAKRRRKDLRSIKKGWNDKINEVEGESYGSGKF